MLKTGGLACALLLAVATAAAAQTATGPATSAGTAVRQHVTEAEFARRLESEGFVNVRDVKPSPDGYSAMATKDGRDTRVGLDQDNKVQVYSEQ